MSVIGDAYIEVKAKTDGFESGAESLFSGFGAKAALAFAGAFAAAGAVGKVLYDIGAQFDESFDQMRVGTGLTGESLEALEDSFKKVASSVPNSFGEVSSTLTTLTQKLGLTGEPLEALGKQFLDLSHITGTDVAANVKAATDLFNNFGVSSEDQAAKLDELFRATQQSGLSIGDLSTQMAASGVALRALGFDFDESTALIAGLAKEGLSASDVMPALSKAMAQAAKDGKDAGTVFQETIDRIKGAPDATAAAGIAMEVFGARSGPRLATLIREGKLSFEDLQASIAGGSDTIAAATADTQDFSEKFAIFKNRVLVGMEPIATAVFEALGKGFDRISAWWDRHGAAVMNGVRDIGATIQDALTPVIPVIVELAEWVGDHLTPILIGLGAAVLVAAGPIAILAAGAIYAYTHFQVVRDVVASVIDFIVTTAVPAVTGFVEHIIASFSDAVTWVQTNMAAIQEAIEHVLRVVRTIIETTLGVLAALWRAWGDDLLNIVGTIFDYVRDTVENAVKFIQGIIKTVLALINGDWGKAWDGIKQALAAVWDQIKNVLSTALDVVKSLIGGVLSSIADTFTSIWTSIGDTVRGAIDTVVGFVTGIGGRVGSAVAGAFDAVKNTAKDAIDGAVGFFTAMPGRIVAAMGAIASAALDVGKAIVNKLGEGLSQVSGFVGDIAGAVTSAVKNAINHVIDLLNDGIPNSLGWGPAKIDLPNNPIPHLAAGGRAMAGRVHLVGEDGPELFVPDSSGTVVPNGRLRSTSSSPTGGPDLTLIYASIDTKGLAERLNIRAAVGDAISSTTRLRPVVRTG